MKKLVFIFALFILLVALVLPACAKPTEENVIKVAVVGPMQFLQGEHHWMGATMAAEEINKAGGIDIGGKKYLLKLIKVDSNEILDVAGA
ncbi:MAG: ABC transporter substrate-binding protein, partial [Chloroflexi bacterium]|nr:ABC transporter substrate-binding protein [Chloroflexota bacterium]